MLLVGLAPGSPLAAQDSDPQPLEVRSEHLTIDTSGRHAEFVGDVVVKQGELYLRCERLSATYDDQGRATAIVARGDVRLSHRELYATASEADYRRATSVVSLSGSPTVWRGAQKLAGRAIRIHLGTERIEVDQPRGSLVLESPPLTTKGEGP